MIENNDIISGLYINTDSYPVNSAILVSLPMLKSVPIEVLNKLSDSQNHKSNIMNGYNFLPAIRSADLDFQNFKKISSLHHILSTFTSKETKDEIVYIDFKNSEFEEHCTIAHDIINIARKYSSTSNDIMNKAIKKASESLEAFYNSYSVYNDNLPVKFNISLYNNGENGLFSIAKDNNHTISKVYWFNEKLAEKCIIRTDDEVLLTTVYRIHIDPVLGISHKSTTFYYYTAVLHSLSELIQMVLIYRLDMENTSIIHGYFSKDAKYRYRYFKLTNRHQHDVVNMIKYYNKLGSLFSYKIDLKNEFIGTTLEKFKHKQG